MTFPSNPEEIKKLQELADRNIANGDWGDEVTVYGLPGEDMPRSPEEGQAQGTISRILSSKGGLRLPKRN